MKILTLNLHERNATIIDIVSRYIPCLKHLDAFFCDLDSFYFAYRIVELEMPPLFPAHLTPNWVMNFKHCMGGHSVDGEQGSCAIL